MVLATVASLKLPSLGTRGSNAGMTVVTSVCSCVGLSSAPLAAVSLARLTSSLHWLVSIADAP